MREMTARAVAGMVLASAVMLMAGCRKELSFDESHLNYQKEVGNRNPTLLDTTATDGYVVALGTTATDRGPRDPGATVYQVVDGGWKAVNGTNCDVGPARVGYAELNVFCGTLREREAEVARILIGEEDVRMFPDEDRRMWYAARDSSIVLVHYLNGAGDTLHTFNTSGRRP